MRPETRLTGFISQVISCEESHSLRTYNVLTDEVSLTYTRILARPIKVHCPSLLFLMGVFLISGHLRNVAKRSKPGNFLACTAGPDEEDEEVDEEEQTSVETSAMSTVKHDSVSGMMTRLEVSPDVRYCTRNVLSTTASAAMNVGKYRWHLCYWVYVVVQTLS